MRAHWRKILQELWKAVAATLFVLLALELLLRVAYAIRNNAVDYIPLPYAIGHSYGPIPPWVDGLRVLEPDAKLIWKNRPNIQRKYVDVFTAAHDEGERWTLIRQFIPSIPKSLEQNPTWEISLNSYGFRNTEFSKEKPASVFRIVCLGDSWTFGANVGQNQAYPQQLAALLKQRFPDAEFEVLNLGVLGYTSFQGLQLLKATALSLKPDVIVIGFSMNDGSVGGWRDKDVSRDELPQAELDVSGLILQVMEDLEIYRLLSYVAELINYTPMGMDERIRSVSNKKGWDDTAGHAGNAMAGYDTLEQWTRVWPVDYEKNILDMISIGNDHDASTILLYNELDQTPYRTFLGRAASKAGVPLVDGRELIVKARSRMEDQFEAKLGLQPSKANLHETPAEVKVIFRVYAGDRAVPKAMYITGPHSQLGDLVPNRIVMHDDGTNGDQTAGDNVWSFAAKFPPRTRVTYVYTNSGAEGKWEGLDVPDVRAFTVGADGNTAYRPIETFGEMYLQADSWHTNAYGYELISTAVLDVLKKDERVKQYLARSKVLAKKHGLKVIEDCAHAIETLYHGNHAGTFGDFGAFSVYVTKNVVTGEGGMVTTQSAELANQFKVMALHGLSGDAGKRFSDGGFKHYEVVAPGFKHNMMDIQAALGVHQLARVEDNLLRRQEIWARYDEAFADLPVYLTPPEEDNTRHARHLYTLILDIDKLRVDRDTVMAALHKQSIGTGIHYRALHLHRYYSQTYAYRRGDLPNAEWLSDRTLSLPLSPKLAAEDVEDVVFAVRRTLEYFVR